MRRRMLASLGGGWKNPYVTDGLVAMWDGEWNAGGGVHDPNATVWKDLSGECHDFSFSSQMVIGMDFVSCSSNTNTSSCVGELELVDILRASDFTFEIVTTGVSQSDTDPTVIAPSVKNFTGIYGSNGNAFCRERLIWAYGYSVTVPHSMSITPNAVFSDMIEKNYNYSGYYVPDWVYNGKLNLLSKMGRFAASMKKCHCIRIYNKELQQEDIEANYAVDKARFNLPDVT